MQVLKSKLEFCFSRIFGKATGYYASLNNAISRVDKLMQLSENFSDYCGFLSPMKNELAGSFCNLIFVFTHGDLWYESVHINK